MRNAPRAPPPPLSLRVGEGEGLTASYPPPFGGWVASLYRLIIPPPRGQMDQSPLIHPINQTTKASPIIALGNRFVVQH